jgi:preprotein translocase subunit SecA
MVSRAIASAQGQVEGRNAEIRKNILKYDDVMNRQREAIYADRRQILKGEDISATFQSFLEETVKDIVAVNLPEGGSQDWDLEQLWVQLKQVYPIGIEISEVLEAAGSRAKLTRTWLIEEILSDARIAYANRTKEVGEVVMRELERRVMLSVIDRKWRDHLYEMDYLKEGIGLRAMAQRDPLVEYQREGYTMFQQMMGSIREETIAYLFNLDVQVQPVDETQDDELTYSAPGEDGQAEVLDAEGQPVQEQKPQPRQAPANPAQQKPEQGGQGSSFFKRS